MNEIDEYAVEEALRLKEAHGGEVTVLSVGPERAAEAIRKALSMGADKAVHVSDPALHGADVVQTAKVIAAAVGRVDGVDLVIAGNEASDGGGGAVPAIVADLGMDAGEVGLGSAWSSVVEAAPKPPRSAGQRVTDEGDGGSAIAAYLVSQKLI